MNKTRRTILETQIMLLDFEIEALDISLKKYSGDNMLIYQLRDKRARKLLVKDRIKLMLGVK